MSDLDKDEDLTRRAFAAYYRITRAAGLIYDQPAN